MLCLILSDWINLTALQHTCLLMGHWQFYHFQHTWTSWKKPLQPGLWPILCVRNTGLPVWNRFTAFIIKIKNNTTCLFVVLFTGRKYRVRQAAANKSICSFKGGCRIYCVLILGVFQGDHWILISIQVTVTQNNREKNNTVKNVNALTKITVLFTFTDITLRFNHCKKKSLEIKIQLFYIIYSVNFNTHKITLTLW